MIVRVVAPYFVAGAVVQQGQVVRAAPIIKYMRGWSTQRVEAYARSKGWSVAYVGTTTPTRPAP